MVVMSKYVRTKTQNKLSTKEYLIKVVKLERCKLK